MRQIKFRAWHTGMGKMFSPEQMGADQLTILPHTGEFINVNSQSPRLSQIATREVMIPMQFTGLLDSAGVEIYEGDVLQFADMHNGTGVIEFVGNGYWVTDNTGKLHLPTTRKVIGNIYQNPNLIPL